MARKIVLSEKAVAFRAGDGQEIIYLTEYARDREVLYSPDGQIYYELVVGGFGGTSAEHNLSFEDPNSGRQGRWHRVGDELVLNNNVIFAKVTTPSEITVEPVPEKRKPEYLFWTRDGRYVYVSKDAYNISYESFRLFIGDGKMMREISITEVKRFRDGGTTYVVTAEGTLFSPASSNDGAKPEWDNEEIEPLAFRRFAISESTTGVTIAPR